MDVTPTAARVAIDLGLAVRLISLDDTNRCPSRKSPPSASNQNGTGRGSDARGALREASGQRCCSRR